jgi:hypothetical protein
MPTIDWPEALIPQTAQLALRKAGTQFASPFNGTLQALDFIAERWVLSASLAQMAMRNPRGVDAFCNTLAGGVERVRVWPFHANGGVPRGTLRGAPTLSAGVTRGATTLPLTNCRGGNNVLREAVLHGTYLTEWIVVNGTTGAAPVPDPTGGSGARTLTRTAAGNHYLQLDLTLATTANRTVRFAVWLRRGTLTGDVNLIVRDGAFGNETIVPVTPTTTWQRFEVDAYMATGAAANLRFFVDPINDPGSAGDTLHFWLAEVEVTTTRTFNAWLQLNSAAGPFGNGRAHRLVRIATGNHDTYAQQTLTAAAGSVWTYSVWLRLGTLTGTVGLRLVDQAATLVASATVTPTGTWQRFQITGTLPADATLLGVVIDPNNNTGAAGDSLEVYGQQIEPGSTPTEFFPDCTLKAGDFVGAGGQLLQVAADAMATRAGDMVLPIVNRARGTIASGSPVTWYRPSCEMVLPAMQAGPVRRPGVIESTALDLVEVW